MTTQELIFQKVEELSKLCEQQADEQKAEGYTGKSVSVFAAVGHHGRNEADERATVSDNTLQGIVIGSKKNVYSSLNTMLKQNGTLAELVHDAACGISHGQHPLESLMETLFNNIKK